MANRIPNINIRGARIFFKNFAGKEQKFNPEGKRNFCVEIPDDMVEQLRDDGWNIKHTRPRDEDYEPRAYLKVNVSFDNYPPDVYLIADGKKVPLDEETVGMIDHADIVNVNVTISPYTWDVNGNTGVSAYLKRIYVEIEDDPFAGDYADMSPVDEEEMPF